MADYVTDTHALIWYLEDDPRLGSAANAAFAACERGEGVVYIPTICLVEIVYLTEKGRISASLTEQLDAVLQTGAMGVALADLTEEIVATLRIVPRAEVPDMPDRLSRQLPFVTSSR
jgi:PIN domain nuclease of toxin-antitoxin system